MSSNNNLNILAGTLITSILLLSWILSGYAAEKKTDNTTIYDDRADYEKLIEKIISKRIRNATIQPNTTIISVTNQTKRNQTKPLEYIECKTNNDCGINGTYVTNAYTCYEEDIYRQYIQYRCEKPATNQSICVGTERNEFISKCNNDEKCVPGDSFCAYEGNIEYMEFSYTAPDSTTLSITQEDTANYKGYKFKAVYVISQHSKTRGLAVDVIRPDGSEEWIYLFYEKEIRFDDLRIGLKDLEKEGRNIYAHIWVNDKK
jgi:hypothetical protein